VLGRPSWLGGSTLLKNGAARSLGKPYGRVGGGKKIICEVFPLHAAISASDQTA
jgi:hypothetical protein